MSSEKESSTGKEKLFKGAAALVGLGLAAGAGAVAAENHDAGQQHESRQETATVYTETLYQPGMRVDVYNGEVSIRLGNEIEGTSLFSSPDEGGKQFTAKELGILHPDEQEVELHRPAVVEGVNGGLWYQSTMWVPGSAEGEQERVSVFTPVGSSTEYATDSPVVADRPYQSDSRYPNDGDSTGEEFGQDEARFGERGDWGRTVPGTIASSYSEAGPEMTFELKDGKTETVPFGTAEIISGR